VWWDKTPDEELKVPTTLTPPRGGGWRTKMLGFVTCLTVAGLRSVGFDVETNRQYQQAIVDVGGTIPALTVNALRWASVFVDDRSVVRVVNTVSTGLVVDHTPPAVRPEDVPNYVPDEFVGKVSAKFEEEVALGRIICGYVDDPRFAGRWGTTAVGVVDKDHSGFQCIRIVNDLSRPRGVSVNECTLMDKYKFASVTDAYRYMTPCAYMSKVDFSAAYRSVGFAERFWMYHVYAWKVDGVDVLLMDLRLMFGHTAGPGEFTELSQIIVRRIKQSGCPGTLGFIDDLITISDTYDECMRCHLLTIELVTFLGFELNPKKVEPCTQDIVYLGIQLQTNADGHCDVVARVDETKIATLNTLCLRVSNQVFIKQKDLEWLVGLMSFCSQVIFGSRLFMRAAYSMLYKLKSSKLRKLGVGRWLRDDLEMWPRLLRENNGQAVSVVRRRLHTDFFAVDASLLTGMGGWFDGDFFAVMWPELAAWPVDWIERWTEFAPFRDVASSHINYLEIFVIWYALFLWGDRLRGYEVLIWTDNTTAEYNVAKLWGKPGMIPILKEIWLLLVRYDVRLRPVPIRSKVNVEADALSRQDWVMLCEAVGLPRTMAAALARKEPWVMQLLLQHCERKAREVTDYDDWMIVYDVFHGWWKRFGPFDYDGAVDVWKGNTWCREGWSIVDDSTHKDWDGLNVYCNPPYSKILEFLVRFLFCKMRTPVATAALFVLPVWDGPRAQTFWKLVGRYPEVFVPVDRYETGSFLFTSPNVRGVNRKQCGPTRWPVVVVRVGPEPLRLEIDLTEWTDDLTLLQ
jgi:hypothetical protein